MRTLTKVTIFATACIVSLYLSSQLALANNSEVPGNTNIEYESYLFAQEWTPNVCAVNKCKKPVPSTTEFNIHGLWPQNSGKDNLTKCSSTKVKYSKLNPELQLRLRTFWNGLYNDEDWFINHEIDNHFTCWNPFLGDATQMDKLNGYF